MAQLFNCSTAYSVYLPQTFDRVAFFSLMRTQNKYFNKWKVTAHTNKNLNQIQFAAATMSFAHWSRVFSSLDMESTVLLHFLTDFDTKSIVSV